MLKKASIALLLSLSATSFGASNTLPTLNPHCGTFQNKHYLASAFYYIGSKYMTYHDLDPFKHSFSHLDVLTYSVASLNNDSTLKLFHSTQHNLNTISNWLKKNNLHTRVFLAVGHWQSKPAYRIMLDSKVRQRFIRSLITFLKNKQYNVTGIDFDWEDEFNLNTPGVKDFYKVVRDTRLAMNKAGLSNMCLTLDLPIGVKFAKRYPKPKRWVPYVNWANVMAYTFYGNAPYTELDGALGMVHAKYGGKAPSYPTLSIENTMRFYATHGVPKRKLALGLAYYADVYYIRHTDKAHGYGLRQKVIDDKPVINISYSGIWKNYGNAAHTKNNAASHYYAFTSPKNIKGARAYWLTKHVGNVPKLGDAYAFISYQDPKAITDIMNYNMQQGFLGMTAWTLGNDLPFENKASLLRAEIIAMNKYARQHSPKTSIKPHKIKPKAAPKKPAIKPEAKVDKYKLLEEKYNTLMRQYMELKKRAK